MHGTRRITSRWARHFDIWFVFRIWEFEVNCGDFICVTCILCVDMLETLNCSYRI